MTHGLTGHCCKPPSRMQDKYTIRGYFPASWHFLYFFPLAQLFQLPQCL
jgi:hypothetical protein